MVADGPRMPARVSAIGKFGTLVPIAADRMSTKLNGRWDAPSWRGGPRRLGNRCTGHWPCAEGKHAANARAGRPAM